MASVRSAALAALFAGTALAAGLAQAQVYRIVGPDGKVTFSDRPPADGKAAPAPSLPVAGGPATSNLPSELRKAVGQYPVTIYSGGGCTPCGQARDLLVRRGVPYTEKTITTEQDVAALKRLSGDSSLPFATIGGQHLNGFSESEWSLYLDAAGYPKSSQLPASYRNPPAAPLVAAQQPAGGTQQANGGGTPAARPAARPAPAPAEEPAENPAGIRF